ncbi:MAG: MFS transporter, partial [Promethearchaeota archaeon]
MASYSNTNILRDMQTENFPDFGRFPPRMKPNTPGKLKYGRTILIGLGFLTSQIAWAYYNFNMPLLLREYLGVFSFWILGTDSFVGLIMILDNVVAIAMLPYFGVLSDHTKSRFGKRMPYILIGCTAGAIFFSLIPHMQLFGALIAVIMLFNISMAFYRNCAVVLMPDLTDPKVRSTGHSVINLMGALALSLGMSAPIIMELIFDASTPEGAKAAQTWGFSYIGVLMLIGLALLFLTVKETPTGYKFLRLAKAPIVTDPITLEYLGEIGRKMGSKGGNRENGGNEGSRGKISKIGFLRAIFTEKDKSALFMLLTIFASLFGFNAIETFYSSFATLWLGWSATQASMALMMAPVALVLIAVPVGKMADKIGRKKTITIGLIGLCICVEVLHLMGIYEGTDLWLSMVMIFFTGVFYAMIAINSVIMIWELAPEGKIGAYTGAYYLFTQAAAIISPVAAGIEFDLYVALYPEKITQYGQGYQYRILFIFVLIWQLVALILITQVKVKNIHHLDRDKINSLQQEYNDTSDASDVSNFANF